jgi:hypothetical protein
MLSRDVRFLDIVYIRMCIETIWIAPTEAERRNLLMRGLPVPRGRWMRVVHRHDAIPVEPFGPFNKIKDKGKEVGGKVKDKGKGIGDKVKNPIVGQIEEYQRMLYYLNLFRQYWWVLLLGVLLLVVVASRGLGGGS